MVLVFEDWANRPHRSAKPGEFTAALSDPATACSAQTAGVRGPDARPLGCRYAQELDDPYGDDGVGNIAAEGRTLRMLVTGAIAPVVRLAGQYELVDFVSREPSLEEVFLSEYGTGAAAGADGAAR